MYKQYGGCTFWSQDYLTATSATSLLNQWLNKKSVLPVDPSEAKDDPAEKFVIEIPPECLVDQRIHRLPTGTKLLLDINVTSGLFGLLSVEGKVVLFDWKGSLYAYEYTLLHAHCSQVNMYLNVFGMIGPNQDCMWISWCAEDNGLLCKLMALDISSCACLIDLPQPHPDFTQVWSCQATYWRSYSKEGWTVDSGSGVHGLPLQEWLTSSKSRHL